MKTSILYMKLKLLTAANHHTMLNIGCDCGVCFLNTPKARIVKKKHGRPKKVASIKVWLVGRVYGARRIFGNCWMVYTI